MGMKRKILTGLAIWFGLGVIVCIFIALQPDKKKAEAATSVVQESKAEEFEKPAFSKENNLSESEKITNPLIRNHVGNMRAVLSGNGSGLGYAQVIYIQTEEFEKITTENARKTTNARDIATLKNLAKTGFCFLDKSLSLKAFLPLTSIGLPSLKE